MDGKLKTLVKETELKATHLLHPKGMAYIRYDSSFDSFSLMFVRPEEAETVVHYVNRYVGLLYDENSREIVGFQIEAFQKKFLPEHAKVARVWENGFKVKDFGELSIRAEAGKIQVAKEVVSATESLFQDKGFPMAGLERAIESRQMAVVV